jgi:hypothetical protein
MRIHSHKSAFSLESSAHIRGSSAAGQQRGRAGRRLPIHKFQVEVALPAELLQRSIAFARTRPEGVDVSQSRLQPTRRQP